MKKYIIILLILLLVGCSQSESQEEKVTLIAHRGAKNLAPEHTLTAYNKAVELGTDFIEIDLRMTKDGQLISIHDETVDRTTNGEGEVSQFTLAELEQLDAGSWFSNEYQGEKIPTLEEIFDTFGKNTNYFIETRPMNGELVMEDELLRLIEEKGLKDYVIIQSFSRDSLKKIHQQNSEIPLVQLLYVNLTKEVREDEVKEYATGVGPYAPTIDKEFVERMHEVGLEVYVWFDNKDEKEFMPKVLSYGVDAVFTDFLDNTVEVMSQDISKQ
ncbi:glycerophosphodiester phosphodiesterase family protein [Ornithinibacillus bavariensis]|uniref:Glycerophosphoryl diester phosphodiesterase n=1 Tax=Ornithinibacillus bavariensis TaxID=545502 RepID=A0A919X8B4_9BACI|nr:glycerophosphodiester phosphodiesterase family protein [Ornithinibacillus bavariensis]GIO26385.1 glycerophosphoryl diester phosphodiesterase [Ornithinibacillus bavariensis]